MRRPNHPSVQHPRQSHVLHEGLPAGHLRRNVHPRHAGAQHREGSGCLELRTRPRHHVQQPRRDQRAIVQSPPVRCHHRPVVEPQLTHGHLENRSGFGQQDLAHLRRGEADRGATVLQGVAAGGIALVWRQRRVGGDQARTVETHRQLLGGDLQQGGLDALAKFRLPGEDRDVAVAVDADPRIQVRRLLQAARQVGDILLGAGLCGSIRRCRVGQRLRMPA